MNASSKLTLMSLCQYFKDSCYLQFLLYFSENTQNEVNSEGWDLNQRDKEKASREIRAVMPKSLNRSCWMKQKHPSVIDEKKTDQRWKVQKGMNRNESMNRKQKGKMMQNKGFGRQRPCYTELRGYYQCRGSFSLKFVTKAFATRKNRCISKNPS